MTTRIIKQIDGMIFVEDSIQGVTKFVDEFSDRHTLWNTGADAQDEIKSVEGMTNNEFYDYAEEKLVDIEYETLRRRETIEALDKHFAQFGENTITDHVKDMLTDNLEHYGDIDGYEHDHSDYSGGSLGMIYNRELEACLDDDGARATISRCLSEYQDATGEALQFNDSHDPLHFLVIFSLEWSFRAGVDAVRYALENV